MIERVIIARDIRMGHDYCRAVGLPPHGAETLILGTPHGLRGLRVKPFQVTFVGPVYERKDYEEILHNLAPLGINSYNANSVPDYGWEDTPRKPEEPELNALATCVEALTPFIDDAKTIDRMMTYLDDRFAVEVTG